jgi:hypothetical protein
MISVYIVIGLIIALFIAAPWIVHVVEEKLGIKHEPETDEE